MRRILFCFTEVGIYALQLVDLTRGDSGLIDVLSTNFDAAWARAVRGEAMLEFEVTSRISDSISASVDDDDQEDDENSIADSTIYIANDALHLTPQQYSRLSVPSLDVVFFKATQSCVYYDFEKLDWFEYKLANTRQGSAGLPRAVASQALIPVTACISSVHGNGGSISREYAVLLSVTEAVSGTLGIKISALVFRAILSTGVGPRFSYSGSFSCTVGAGEYAQLFIEPFYIQVPESNRRRVMWDRLRGLVPRGDVWEEFERFNLIAQHRPNHVCVVERLVEKLQCDHLVTHHELDFGLSES